MFHLAACPQQAAELRSVSVRRTCVAMWDVLNLTGLSWCRSPKHSKPEVDVSFNPRSIQLRFPRGLKVHVHSVDRFGCLAQLTRVLKTADLAITRAKVRSPVCFSMFRSLSCEQGQSVRGSILGLQLSAFDCFATGEDVRSQQQQRPHVLRDGG